MLKTEIPFLEAEENLSKNWLHAPARYATRKHGEGVAAGARGERYAQSWRSGTSQKEQLRAVYGVVESRPQQRQPSELEPMVVGENLELEFRRFNGHVRGSFRR
jgi:hypothetical protein